MHFISVGCILLSSSYIYLYTYTWSVYSKSTHIPCMENREVIPIYSRFQVTFQSAFPKFVLNIPNYITKFGILLENVHSEICMLVN